MKYLVLAVMLAFAGCTTEVSYQEPEPAVQTVVAGSPVVVDEDGPDFVFVEGHRMHRNSVEFHRYQSTHRVTYRHRHH